MKFLIAVSFYAFPGFVFASACPEAFSLSTNQTQQANPQPTSQALKVANGKWTLAQETALLAYQQAREGQAKSFLHIAPLSKGNNMLMAQVLVEQLIQTSQKEEKSNQDPKIAIVALNQAQSIEPLIRTIEEVALKYAKLKDTQVINWNKGQKDLALELSPDSNNIVVMTYHKLRQVLRTPDSENYDLLLSHLSQVSLRFTPPLVETDLIKTVVVNLREHSSVFLYGMGTAQIYQELSIKNLFEKIHWSYVNTKDSLFKEPIFSDSTKALLEPFVQGVQQGELTPFKEPYFLDLSTLQMPNKPLFISEKGHLNMLNPFYHPLLARKLTPILQSHQKGIILTTTDSSAKLLTDFLNETFPDMNFAHYSHSRPHEERQDILRASHEEKHYYIVSARQVTEIENMPHLSAYIDLNVYVPIADRLAMASPVLSLYEGKSESKLVLLVPHPQGRNPPRGRGLDARKAGDTTGPCSIDCDSQPSLKRPQSSSRRNSSKNTKTKPTQTKKLPWEQALEKVRKAKLSGLREYRKWQAKHPDMPVKPDQYKAYQAYWQGWKHFLGNEKLPWAQALEKVRKAKLSGAREYRKWQAKHPDMPFKPYLYQAYQAYWKNWKHFLGNTALPWEQVLQKVRTAQLPNREAYKKWQRNHPNIPSHPNEYKVYRPYWKSWTHFLGKVSILPWPQALKKVRQAKLENLREYRKWQAKHPDMPLHPNKYKAYRPYWKSWDHFFGNENLPWEQALEKARKAKLSGSREYKKWQKDHLNMPSHPDLYKAYQAYWQGWRHFLGNTKLKEKNDTSSTTTTRTKSSSLSL